MSRRHSPRNTAAIALEGSCSTVRLWIELRPTASSERDPSAPEMASVGARSHRGPGRARRYPNYSWLHSGVVPSIGSLVLVPNFDRWRPSDQPSILHTAAFALLRRALHLLP